MKRLNSKFVLFFVGTFFAVAVGVYVLHSYQVERNANNLTKRAAEFRENGEYRESIRLLERYLGYRPDDTEAWSLFATDLVALVTETEDFERHDLMKAFTYIEDVLRDDPTNHELRQKAIQFFMMIRRYTDVIAHIELLHEDPDFKTNNLETYIDLTITLARCHAMSGDLDKSIKELEPLIGYDSETSAFEPSLATAPNSVDAFLLMAAICQQNDETEKLDAIYNQVVELNPDSHRAFLERARFRRGKNTDDKEKHLEEAQQDIDEALRLAPEDEQVILMASETAMAAGDLLKAKEHLTIGLEKHPQSTAMYLSRSDLARQEEGIEQALEWIQKGLNANQNNGLLILKRAELEMSNNDVASARSSIEQLKLSNARSDWIEYLEVRLLMMEKNWLQAAKKLETIRGPLLDQNPHLRPQVFISLVQCYEQLEQWDLVIQAATQVPDESSARFTALLAQATAYHRKQQYDQAIQHYGLIVETFEKNNLPIQPTVALSFLSLLIEQQNKLPKEAQDWSKPKQALKYVVENKSLPLGEKERAKLQYVISRFGTDKARQYIAKVHTKYPDDPQIAILNERLNPQDKPSESTEPVELDLATLQGRLQKIQQTLQQSNDDVPNQLSELEQDIADWEDRAKLALWNALSVRYLMMRQFDDVFRLWKQIAELDKNNLKVRVKRFELAFERSDEERINESLDMLEEIAGEDSNEWKLAESMRITWLVREGREDVSRLEDVRHLLRDIEDQRPNWTSLLRMWATVALMQNDIDNAVEYLERALTNGQNDIALVQQLSDIYIKLNRKDDALRVLNSLDAGQRTPLVLRWMLTLQDEKVEISEVDEVVSPESENADDLIWRGQILAKNKHLPQSFEAFKRVTEVHPQLPNSWINYVNFLLNARKRDLANAAIESAQTSLPEQVSNETVARCYWMAASQGAPTPEERGLAIKKAEQAYLQAIENDPTKPHLLQNIASFYLNVGQETKAEKFLDQILADSEPYLEQTPVPIAWARRSKAKVLANSGSFQDYLQAMEQLRKNVPVGSKLKSSDLKVMAEITLPRPDSISQKNVIKELESLQESRRLTTEENIFLARLYQRVQRYNDSEEVLYALFVDSPKNQQIVGLLIETLLQQDKLKAAEQMLEKLPSNSLNRYRIKALMLAKRGQPEKAAAELTKLIPANLSPEQHGLLRNIATLLEEIEQDDVAEKVWREYVKREPQHHLLLAAFLGRCQGVEKIDQAFNICGNALQAGGNRIESIAQIGVATLRNNMQEIDEAGSKNKYFDLVEKWFDEGFQRVPDSKSLKLQLAEFETMRGNTDKVITIYKDFLTQKGLDNQQRALVQNNLAYVLAIAGLQYIEEESEKGVELGKEAFEFISKAITYLGPMPHLLDTRAMAKLAMRDYSDAQHDLNTALDEGDSGSLRFHLAYANFMARNPGAEEEMRRAIEIGLSPYSMHPIERQIYHRMVSQFNLQGLAVNSR